MSEPPQPPVPFADFEYTFDPALSSLFPPPLPLPSSADLFSPSETTDLLGFLDHFNWEFDGEPPSNETHDSSQLPYSSSEIDDSSGQPQPSSAPHASTSDRNSNSPLEESNPDIESNDRSKNHVQSSANGTRSGVKRKSAPAPRQSATRIKPLLSSPQKRLNHIMSEQKRRNAIRDGYAQLISLLAPDGAHALDMPTRGRPKGSGSGAKGQTKGKSGVLFRAVEYCRWLEEGRDALKAEVLRVEAAARI
ncbi:hypothetical protein BJ138DRAFT_1143204 [Hygrophoropsis aurantiaca]|uniref:Uncharacterized protein n=1 Tax=Hygrophoropsis aurantiaca TaxID=72124 RepID=A0ACB8ANJ7_9AGAM|nr:hypothetical protein BJ138DRAFT_1143204 [Hygrophoropsis aurantiaca]